ncbi:hypothetical protein I4U23_014679 [Adineta vaga]|nr:hypothetical protein I4U23_014679 [Adineta vaga]
MKEKDWPNGYGQLTSAGIEQHRRLGQYLRIRYGSILSTTYSPREIFVRSTDFDRTLMSAQSNLVGLYPQMNMTSDKVPIQPIPIHTVPTSEDYLLGQSDCFLYNGVGQEVYQSEEFKRLNKYYEPLFRKLEIWSNLTNITLYNTWGLPDAIFIEHIYNKAPAWADEDVRKSLSEISDINFYFAFSNDRIKRLRGGPVIQDMWLNMNNSVHNDTFHKLKIYSGHDGTVSAALAFLRVNYPRQPQYASALFLDLYRQNGTYFVKVEYLNVTDSNKPYAYVLDGCPTTECPLDIFTAIYQPRFPGTMQIECGHMPTSTERNNKLVILLLSLLIVGLLLPALGLSVFAYRQKIQRYAQIPTDEVADPSL